MIYTTNSYCAEHSIKPEIIKRYCGLLVILGCRFNGAGGFEVDPDEGEDAAMIPVLDDECNLANYCAWPVDNPSSFVTDMPAVDCPLLGSWNLANPASWAFGERLMVHRTPLRWLKSGCKGVVVLDHRVGFVRLREALGDLEAEDEAHGLMLDRLINQPRWEHKIKISI